MAFDRDSDLPVLQPHKKTTQVNIWMVVGVIVFLILGAVAVVQYGLHHQHAPVPIEQR